MQQNTNKITSLKSLNKSNVWDIQENDIFRLCDGADKDADVKENIRHYVDIMRSAFSIEELTVDKPVIRQKYEKLGYKVGSVKIGEGLKALWAIKKKPIQRVTDLTYENIRHISASKLLEVIDRNFGGGWDSLSQSIKDIIESGFDISTTTLPANKLHKKGGMYEKKVEDGYEVLEITKGTWVEAIFAKLKPETEKPRMLFNTHDDEDEFIEDTFNKPSEDDDPEIEDPNDDEINEDNYSTMMDLGSPDPDEEAEGLAVYDD